MKMSRKDRKVRLINQDTGESMLVELKDRKINLLEKTEPKKDINRIKGKTNKRCYFCDFEYLVDKHHLVQGIKKGNTLKNNILELCPNHHYLIHRTEFEIIYMDGFFFLYSILRNKIICPFKRESLKKRECPRFIKKFTIKNNILEVVRND